MGVRRLALLGCALFSACPGLRSTPATRYQGILLNARGLGAEQLRVEEAHDATLRDYVARTGAPDFILAASPTDVELVYVGASRLVHFHRAGPGAASVAHELSPLPEAILGLLPADPRAGTPAPLAGEGVGCWTTPLDPGSCRTCCGTGLACQSQCTTR